MKSLWISKYALTDGIKAVDSDGEVTPYGYVSVKGYWNSFKLGKDIHETEAEAKQAAEKKRLAKIGSLADVFDNQVLSEWRDDLWRLIEATPDLDWLLLTKRIGNVGNMLPVPFDFDRLYPNVWIGATITSQAEADRDIPKLLAVPARVRFLSMEPLLGPVDLTRVSPGIFAATANTLTGVWKWDDGPKKKEASPLDWVIVGGESGPSARPMHPDWARSLRDQCAGAGVPFLFKQWGEWGPDWEGAETCQACGRTKFNAINSYGECGHCGIDAWMPADKPLDKLRRIGKKAAGRLLDGAQHDGFPGTSS